MDNLPISPMFINAGYRFESSTFEPLTPTSPGPRPEGYSQSSLVGHFGAQPYWHKMASAAPVFMLNPFGTEAEYGPFPNDISTSPLHQESGFDFNQMSETSGSRNNSVSSFGLPTASRMCEYFPDGNAQAPLMLSSQSFSGSESAEPMSPWSCGDGSPVSFSPRRQLSFDSDQYPPSPLSTYSLRESNSTCQMPAEPGMRSHMISPTKSRQVSVASSKSQPMTIQADVIEKTTSKCDYPGCNKGFRRVEHLKRHKQTYHAEGPHRFSCEFCGKDQFNRNDNLQTHRRLHARPKNRNRGVGFLPAAVSVIEKEDLARKRRAPSRSKRPSV